MYFLGGFIVDLVKNPEYNFHSLASVMKLLMVSVFMKTRQTLVGDGRDMLHKDLSNHLFACLSVLVLYLPYVIFRSCIYIMLSVPNTLVDLV